MKSPTEDLARAAGQDAATRRGWHGYRLTDTAHLPGEPHGKYWHCASGLLSTRHGCQVWLRTARRMEPDSIFAVWIDRSGE
jgi:hypothetical protein